MRYLLLALLTACGAVGTEPNEPTPLSPDADTSPMQTPSTLVLARDFDTYCTRDDECAAIYEGNACAPDRCANAAIRRDALPRYRAELGAYWACYEPQGEVCAAAIGDAAACVAGRCVLPGL